MCQVSIGSGNRAVNKRNQALALINLTVLKQVEGDLISPPYPVLIKDSQRRRRTQMFLCIITVPWSIGMFLI